MNVMSLFIFFFFKQKTAYEMRISDWISDVCSSDLDQSGRQVVVATLADLQGYDIADYGYRLGRTWGIGQKGEDNGALLIVAPGERKVRIEVGYGLEGILTDAMSSIIIQRAIIPHFKQDDYPGGIAAGVNEIGKLLALPPDEARARALEAEQQ